MKGNKLLCKNCNMNEADSKFCSPKCYREYRKKNPHLYPVKVNDEIRKKQSDTRKRLIKEGKIKLPTTKGLKFSNEVNSKKGLKGKNNPRYKDGKWVKRQTPIKCMRKGCDTMTTNKKYCSTRCNGIVQAEKLLKIPYTKERKEKLRKRFSGSKNPMYGKPCSEERKRKIGIANSGKNSSFWVDGFFSMKIKHRKWK